jgi:hypothetical protein
MTKEKAKLLIEEVIDDYWEDDGYGNTTQHYDDVTDALYMAIGALEQEPCEDAVSKQAVLEGIAKWVADGYADSEEDIFHISSLVTNLPSVTPTQRWIPVSEKLPNDRDWYLGIFKEPDTGWINPLPFICDYVGSKTKATTKEHWILRGFTDRDEHIDYYFNLECVAWMPLPKPYRAEMEGKE